MNFPPRTSTTKGERVKPEPPRAHGALSSDTAGPQTLPRGKLSIARMRLPQPRTPSTHRNSRHMVPETLGRALVANGAVQDQTCTSPDSQNICRKLRCISCV